MAGQPNVFDWAVTIPFEGPGAALAPPYAIITSPNTLSLRAYFHCGGRDRVERTRIQTALGGGAATVSFFLQRIDFILGSIAVTPAAVAIPLMTSALLQPEFQGAGDLVGSGLDPTDDYYRTAVIPVLYVAPPAGTTQLFRVLTVLRAPGNVTAFDDSLVIQILA